MDTAQVSQLSAPAVKVFTGTAKKLLDWIVSGLTQAEAARACGVDKTYVSQLCEDPDFKSQVDAAKNVKVAQKIEVGNLYDDAELTALRNVKEALNWTTNLDDNLRVVAVLSKSRPKTAIVDHNKPENSPQPVVRLQLPAFIVQQFFINPNSEVVAIGDTALTTLNAASMDSIAADYTRIQEENSKIDPSPDDLLSQEISAISASQLTDPNFILQKIEKHNGRKSDPYSDL